MHVPCSTGCWRHNSTYCLICRCLAGKAELCGRFWEEGSPHARALQRWLLAAQQLFPAFPEPMLRLLGAVSAGQHAQPATVFLKGIAEVCLSIPAILLCNCSAEVGMLSQQAALRADVTLKILDLPYASTTVPHR